MAAALPMGNGATTPDTLCEQILRRKRGARGRVVMPAPEGDSMVDPHGLARPKSSGVESTLMVRTELSAASTTMSVKVPPMSAPIRTDLIKFIAVKS